jgi:hypothetical protein
VTGDGLPAGVNARDAVDLVAYMERMARKREWEYQLELISRRWDALGLHERPHRAHGRIVANYIEGRIDADALIEQIGTLGAHELPPVTDD